MGLCALPELLDRGPFLVSAMRRLFKVFLRSVVLVALGSIQAPVEIGLPIVSDIEDIKVIVPL